jgi:UMF1 family MFS transporter
MSNRLVRTLAPGVRIVEVWAWAMLDFASSGYTTVVLTAVFSAYFVGVIAAGATWATLAWTSSLSVSYLLVMLTLPKWAAMADAHAGKRRLLFTSVVGCVFGTLLLSRAGPGDLWFAACALVLSNYCFSLGESAIASFLPELAQREALGRVSGWGWGLGYLGGLLSLAVALVIVTQGAEQGLGVERIVPWVMLTIAGLFLLATLPAWFWLKERTVATRKKAASTCVALRQTWVEISSCFPEFRRFLLCIVSYQAGISVVITLAAVYAEQVMGFQMTQTIALIAVVNIAAGVGALLFGRVQDRLGHQRALQVTLIGWVLTSVSAFLAVQAWLFWVAACLAGICMGTSQSAGRAMVGMMAPTGRLSMFYGLWTFATQLAAAIGPLVYGLITWVSGGNQRLAMLCTAFFFIFALWVLGRLSLSRAMTQRDAAC